jgi:hypothetical protein
MNEKKLNRELNYLLSINLYLPLKTLYFGIGFDEFKTSKKAEHKEIVESEYYPKKKKQQSSDTMRIFELAEILGLSDDELLKRWKGMIHMRKEQMVDYQNKPIKEGRDNKGVYVGSGGYNKNMVRYPSKKRSKRTWRIFYEMFPKFAKLDGWDGNKSNKFGG